jgi:hypothetical protein
VGAPPVSGDAADAGGADSRDAMLAD